MNNPKRNSNNTQKLSPLVQQALERYRAILPKIDFIKLSTFLTEPIIPSIRINLLKHDPKVFMQELKKHYGWEMQPIPYCTNGYWVKAPSAEISTTIEHRMGNYYIQDAASMLPVELFNFSHNRQVLILDMAASPGGKTTHLADKTSDHGLIIANDASRARISALRIELQNWGVINAAVTCLNGSYFGEQLPESFDYVLLDAPCSMENLRNTTSHPMRAITSGERRHLANRQLHLLRSAIQAVKPGGQVIYATCTLSPEENETIVAAILDEMQSFITLDDVSDKLPKPAPALIWDGSRKYPDEIKKALRLWPHIFRTSGFFSARFTKTRSTGSKSKTRFPNKKKIHTKNLPQLQKRDVDDLINYFQVIYGFDLSTLLKDQSLSLRTRGREIWATPRLVLEKIFHPATDFNWNTDSQKNPSGIYTITCFHRALRFTVPREKAGN